MNETSTTLPLVLLPGLICDEAVWTVQCGRFGGARECIVADYGLLDSIEAMAQYVLDSIGTQRFALAGHSMGGRVAMEIVRRAPQRVERLALMDTGYTPRHTGEAGEKEREGRFSLLQAARARGMREMGRIWARGMVHPDHVQAPVFQEILDMIDRKTPDIYAAQINALLGRPDATGLLPTIACPTLLLCGREDSWSPVPQHERMLQAIPGSWLTVIEQSGHMTTMEQPDAVGDAMADWLARPAA